MRKSRSRERGISITYTEGQQVGNFLFIKETEGRRLLNGRISRRADFKCECGKIFNAAIAEIKHRGQKTCGCIWKHKIQASTKHNGVGAREYNIWRGMRKRCNNKNSQDYKDYGGRGIVICKEWSDFKNFLQDMGKVPSITHSLDRIDGDLGYNKSNCRWATPKEQAINRKTTIYLSFNGRRMTIEDWTIETGMSRTLIESRLAKKWSHEKILTTPKLNQFI